MSRHARRDQSDARINNLNRHCEEGTDEAIHFNTAKPERCARDDAEDVMEKRRAMLAATVQILALTT